MLVSVASGTGHQTMLLFNLEINFPNRNQPSNECRREQRIQDFHGRSMARPLRLLTAIANVHDLDTMFILPATASR
jgi:hypothetical protein